MISDGKQTEWPYGYDKHDQLNVRALNEHSPVFDHIFFIDQARGSSPNHAEEKTIALELRTTLFSWPGGGGQQSSTSIHMVRSF